jgi:nicotinamide mononucleotide (NMN) deamidase PncC
MAWCIDGQVDCEMQIFKGDRQAIRETTTAHALQGLLLRLPASTN